MAELGALPETAEDGDMLICHGSPVSDVRSFLPEPAEDEAELLEGVAAPRLVFGHTHLPFRRIGRRASSWSTPARSACRSTATTAPRTRVIHDDGRVEHRRVAYDHAASAAKVRSLGERGPRSSRCRIERARAGGALGSARADAGGARGGRARRDAAAAR